MCDCVCVVSECKPLAPGDRVKVIVRGKYARGTVRVVTTLQDGVRKERCSLVYVFLFVCVVL